MLFSGVTWWLLKDKDAVLNIIDDSSLPWDADAARQGAFCHLSDA